VIVRLEESAARPADQTIDGGVIADARVICGQLQLCAAQPHAYAAHAGSTTLFDLGCLLLE